MLTRINGTRQDSHAKRSKLENELDKINHLLQ